MRAQESRLPASAVGCRPAKEEEVEGKEGRAGLRREPIGRAVPSPHAIGRAPSCVSLRFGPQTGSLAPAGSLREGSTAGWRSGRRRVWPSAGRSRAEGPTTGGARSGRSGRAGPGSAAGGRRALARTIGPGRFGGPWPSGLCLEWSGDGCRSLCRWDFCLFPTPRTAVGKAADAPWCHRSWP